MYANATQQNEENFFLCMIPEAESLEKCPTIGRLLHELEKILHYELETNPTSEATKDLEKNLATLNKVYQEEIPKIVDNYQQEYPSWIREKLPKAEEQYKKLVNWSDDIDNPGKEFRQAIKELREKYYDDRENCLKVEWERTQQQLKNGKCCRDRAFKLKEIIEQEFDKSKKFKDTVNNWFKELDKIYKQADEVLLDQENYKALYAYRLEFDSILQELRQLKPDETKRRIQNSTIVKDWEWLKSLLTKYLRDYCLITYEHFYWQKNWLELIEQEEKAATNYRDFKKSRGEDFVREAQDVELPKDDSCNDQSPARYQDTVAI